MNNINRLLEQTDTVLLIDWPGEDCPRSIVRAGFTVFGQEPDGWLRYEVKHYQLQKHPLADPPAHVDLVFCYRPFEELPEYVATAQKLAAKVFWYHSGLCKRFDRIPEGLLAFRRNPYQGAVEWSKMLASSTLMRCTSAMLSEHSTSASLADPLIERAPDTQAPRRIQRHSCRFSVANFGLAD